MDRQSVLIVVKELISGNRVSTTAALLLAQLLDHRNKKTGQCNPRRKVLARELNVHPATITRALTELRKAGFIRSKQGQRTSDYEIQDTQFAHPEHGSGYAFCAPQDTQFAHPEAPYPLYEPYQVEPERLRAEARRRRPPNSETSPNTTSAPVVARKGMGREMTSIDNGGPFDLYYSAVLGSLRDRGRLLTANESRQVGNLMMLRQIERLKKEGKVS